MKFNNVAEIEQSLAEQNIAFSMPSSIPADQAVSGQEQVDPIQQPDLNTPVAQEIDYNADEPSLIADLALAPIRGILNATESVADLVTFGNVPEGSINRLGRSQTMAGGFVENATDFLVGFTPGFGWLSRASKLGKLAKLGKIGKFVAKSNVAKGAIAGAVADFTVFDEHQERLSNLIESVPELQNPITEYLASDQDDGLFEGRLKNAVEGVLAGGVIDGVISGVKALKGAKKAVEAGDSKLAETILGDAGNTIDLTLKQEQAITKGADLSEQEFVPQELPFSPSEASPVLLEKQTLLPDPVKVSASKEIRTLNKQFQEGTLDATGLASGIEGLVAKLDQQRVVKTITEASKDRVRGADFIEEKLLNAKRTGALDEESVDFARWAIQQNPDLVESLGISIRKPKEADSLSAGQYNPLNEIVTLFKGQAREGTIVHEIMHHAERIMPKEIQAGIRKEWSKAYSKALADATKAGDAVRVESLQAMFNSLLDVPGTSDTLKELFDSGKLKNEDYFLVNPSEFWAEKATSILSDRFLAKESWVSKAKQWLKEFYEKIKGFAGVASNSSILSGIKNVLESDGSFSSKGMLSDPRYGFKSLNDKTQLSASTFLGNLPSTGRILDIANSPQGLGMATIEQIREAISGDPGRPIVNIFLNSGPASTHKAVTSLVGEFVNELTARKIVTKPEVVAEELENIKRLGGEAYIKDLTIKAKGTEELSNLIMGFKFARMDILNQVGKIVDTTLEAKNKMSSNPLDEKSILNYKEGFVRLNELMPHLKTVLFGEKRSRSNIMRAGAMMKQTKFDAKMADDFAEIQKRWASNPGKMNQYGTALAESIGDGDAKIGFENFDEALRRFAILYKKHGPDGIVSASPDKFWIKMHNEWWINALLSGPRTFGVNAIGNLIATMWKPAESALGAQSAYMRTGNSKFKVMRNAFLSTYGNMIDVAKESIVSANNAFKSGESTLVQGRTAVEQYDPIITKENFQAKLEELEINNPSASPLIKGIAKFLVTDATTKVGNVIRLPTKALLWMDEFTKHINFRAVAKTRALAEAYDEGGELVAKNQLSSESLDEWVAGRTDEKINNLIMDGGGLYSMKNVRMRGALEGSRAGKGGIELEEYITDYIEKNYDSNKSSLAEYAYGWAEEVTFTKKGAEGTFQRGLERLVRDHPTLRLVVPFVTTPTNIIKFFGQRAFGVLALAEGSSKNVKLATSLDSVAPQLSKTHLELTKELYSTDPFVRAQAEGKIAMGLAVMSTAVGLWGNGSITGQGPSNEKERILKQATGWQPYSFRFKPVGSNTYTYISYQRFDPLATFLGVVADFADKANEDQASSKDWITFVGSAIGTALSKNITSKSYLTGIEQIMDAVNDPDRKMSQFVNTRAGSLVVPSLVSQLVPSGDPLMREARTILETITKRIPGASTALMPKRNILGEPIKRPEAFGPDFISPIFISEQKKDKVMDELANLKYSFSMPSPVESGGVDLSTYRNNKGQTAYDRYMELTGSVTINNKNLRQALNKLVTSSEYLDLPDDSVEGLDSPRISELKKVIGKYRSTAKDKMIKEFPELYSHRVLRDKLIMARKQGKNMQAQQVLAELQNAQ